MRVKASTKGQIVIPAPIRRKFGIKEGTAIEVVEDDTQIVLRPQSPQALEKLLDKLQGKYKGSGLLKGLMEARARDREKEDAGWKPPRLR
jgi:AbrB family looped-hinge helix DNA binding protein